MISLTPRILVRVSSGYNNEMNDKLENLYKKVVDIKPIEGNPFNSRPYTDMFEDGQGLNLQLVTDLLTKPLDYIKTNYSEIKNYILTCQLVYFSSFKVDYELRKINEPLNKINRENFRKEYVNRYDNPWIRNIKGRHPSFYKNSKSFVNFINEVGENLEDLNNKLKDIVDYDVMDSKYRHKLLSEIGIEVCPYCNRQYITKYEEKGVFKTTADLDHFFPKCIFQLLSLSLFNFVPSCQICNSRFKLAKSSEILYPYDRGFDDDSYFVVKLKKNSTIDSLTGNNTLFDLDLTVNSQSSHRNMIENSIELFRLKKVYQSHKDYVRELLYKKHAWSNKAYESLVNNLFLEMKLESTDINLFLYGNNLDPADFGKRPLSKITYDIINKN
ncbi:hypothetical protein CON18_13015 [Bacillus cereus]|uniref:hypothetical protein n=1 Tax=Bacillus cereus TaxID=1396 RepID=UPI000BEE30A4|nr:hypothetical protein [Bacillus cereus]PDZ39782.1 hypothetical protein CON18_13015 [Bacillus cereus]PFA14384.1 hypothetical protein CN377_10850 [Bacillus cereus]PFS81160.1 hypothetical protein COK49_11165 [Bacillus cereus]PGS17373.1 hypothetical protein COC51_05515 [Bacillus cereus]PGV31247.1 hypothetical protein COD93_04210 [Bacillus cereus]